VTLRLCLIHHQTQLLEFEADLEVDLVVVYGWVGLVVGGLVGELVGDVDGVLPLLLEDGFAEVELRLVHRRLL
jgi:hypothetical protein